MWSVIVKCEMWLLEWKLPLLADIVSNYKYSKLALYCSQNIWYSLLFLMEIMVQSVTVGAVSHESFGTYLILCPEVQQQQKKVYKTLSVLCPSLSLTWKVRSCVQMFSKEQYSAFW